MKRLLSMILSAAVIATMAPSLSARAAEYSLKQMTPDVERALLRRKERFDTLESYKAAGVIGENNRGYAEALGADPRAAALVRDENTDRKMIYQTIAEQNGLTSQIDVIEKIFAQVQRENARAGYKIQAADGTWSMK